MAQMTAGFGISVESSSTYREPQEVCEKTPGFRLEMTTFRISVKFNSLGKSRCPFLSQCSPQA